MNNPRVNLFLFIVQTGPTQKKYARVQYAEDGTINEFSEKIMHMTAEHKVIRFIDAERGGNIILNLGAIQSIEIFEGSIDYRVVDKKLIDVLRKEGYELGDDGIYAITCKPAE